MVRQNILAGRIKEAFKSHLLNEEAILIEKEVVVGSLKIRVRCVSLHGYHQVSLICVLVDLG